MAAGKYPGKARVVAALPLAGNGTVHGDAGDDTLLGATGATGSTAARLTPTNDPTAPDFRKGPSFRHKHRPRSFRAS
jgi:hypothetical protein